MSLLVSGFVLGYSKSYNLGFKIAKGKYVLRQTELEFSSKEKKGHISRLEKKIAALEGKLSQKNEVLAELMEEYVSLKKNFGEI